MRAMHPRTVPLAAVSILALSLLTLAVPQARPDEPDPARITTPAAPAFAPDDPRSAVEALVLAYCAQDAAAYGEQMSEDFRFIFAEKELNARHPGGLTRVDEVESAAHLFKGFTDKCGVPRPRAKGIAIEPGELELYGDAEEAAELEERAVVVADALTLRIEFVNGTFHQSRTTNLYWVARACPLAPGSSTRPALWRIRRWQEEPPRELVDQVRALPFVRCAPAIAVAN